KKSPVKDRDSSTGGWLTVVDWREMVSLSQANPVILHQNAGIASPTGQARRSWVQFALCALAWAVVSVGVVFLVCSGGLFEKLGKRREPGMAIPEALRVRIKDCIRAYREEHGEETCSNATFQQIEDEACE